MKTVLNTPIGKKARHAARLAIAALPLALAACGSAQPTQPTNPVGGIGGSVGTLPAASCVPITQQIPFTASNAVVTQRAIWAGAIPGYGSVGTVLVGGAIAGGGRYQGVGLDNSVISMNLTPAGQQIGTQPGLTGAGAWGTWGSLPADYWLNSQSYVTASGFLQIGQMLQQQAALMVQLGQIPIPGRSTGQFGTTQNWMTPSPTMPTQTLGFNPAQLCVSGIALGGVDVLANSTYVHHGDVYVYLNNTQHGFTIDF
jgi:hypothetical protein